VTQAIELVEHDEFGEALDLICTQLYEFDAPVSKSLYDLVVATADLIEWPRTELDYFRKLLTE
jgi:hypothetical protein